MRRISILNFKGGTGKTSVATNLSAALTQRGYTCLLIDADRQSNTTTTLLGQRVNPDLNDFYTNAKMKIGDVIYEAREGLYLIPSGTNLDHISKFLRDNPRWYPKMRDGLASLGGQGIDFVLIDQAASYSILMGALLEASDEMLIPCELEPYAVQGLRDMFTKLGQELEGHELKNTGIIPYNTNMSRGMTESYLQELRSTFGHLVTSEVRTDTAVPYSQSKQMTIFEYEKEVKVRSKAAHDFRMLADRLLLPQEVTA